MDHPHIELGVGIYTRTDAARLLGLTPRRLSRWVQGYTYWLRSGTQSRRTSKPPIVRTDLPSIGGAAALSFLELMELRVVRGFVQKGVPLQRVRGAARRVADLFDTVHPFAHRGLFTDRQQIFVDLADAEAQPGLLQVTGRKASPQLLAGGLLEGHVDEMDFDAQTSLAARWFPLGRGVAIVLDPRIAFGAPVLLGTRIRTDVLSAYASGNREQSVARAFDLPVDQVRAAVAFEAHLGRAA
ncbi:MAG: DUF433 domain-containing protein [Gemmatimonadales bacterium]